MIECIPVARPQDLATPGEGKIKFISEEEVKGIGTKFLTQVKQGANLYIKGEIPDQVVAEVINDESLKLKSPGAIKFH